MKAIKSIVFIFTLLFFLFPTNRQLKAQEGKDFFTVCTACHTIGGGKLIGPDLKGISERRNEDWLIKFIQNSQEQIQAGDKIAVQLFEEFNFIPMPPNNLSDDEVRILLSYINNPTGEAAVPQPITEIVEPEEFVIEPAYMKKANARNHGTIFYLALILLIIAFADLVFTRIIKARFVHIITMLISIFIMGKIIVVEAQSLGRQQYYQPEQPIAFSHKVHTGQNQINCLYCHTTASESMYAGIPSTQLCMNCHAVVKSGATTGTKEIAKIFKSLESGKPIEWIKVHNNPDHVFFSHAQHVAVGKLDCVDCHGPVETMDLVMQVNDLSMGWCIECHRTQEVQFSNEFYANYKTLHEDLNSGKKSIITVDNIGGNDCQKCHY
ncbi:MAG: c-type cytochrome [Bacteroidetes bacterium]|nr:c-type cytochrome [Bacteroidota bacterium]